MRARFFANDLKCQRMIESAENIWRNDSTLPLQIRSRVSERTAVRRSRRPSESQRG